MSHNYVREWREFEHLSELPCLEDLVFIGNPLEEESITVQKYNDEVIKRLLILKKLDGFPVIREADKDDEEEVSSILDMNEIDKLARGDSDEEESEEEDPQDEEAPEDEGPLPGGEEMEDEMGGQEDSEGSEMADSVEENELGDWLTILY